MYRSTNPTARFYATRYQIPASLHGSIDKAVANSKLPIEQLGARVFAVTGSTGSVYTVVVAANLESSTCGCEAGRRGRACWHQARAFLALKAPINPAKLETIPCRACELDRCSQAYHDRLKAEAEAAYLKGIEADICGAA